MKAFLLSVIFLLLSACQETMPVRKIVANSHQPQIPLEVIERASPKYPESAAFTCTEGYVQLSFVVQKNGSIKDIKVIKAKPVDVFESAAIAAVSKWRFKPILTEQKATQKLGFKLNKCVIASATNKSVSNPEILFNEAAQLYTEYNLLTSVDKEYKLFTAIEKLEQANKIAPNHPNTLHNLALYLREAKSNEKSAKYYYQLMQLEPNNSHIQKVYAETKVLAFINTKKCNEAEAFIKQLTAEQTESATLNWNLATCYQDIDNNAKALEYWLQVAKIEPNDMQARAKIVQVYQGLNDIEQRDNALNILLKMYQDNTDPEYIKNNIFCREQYNIGKDKVMIFQYFDPTKNNGTFNQPFDVKKDNQYFYRYSAVDPTGKEKFFLSLASYSVTTKAARLEKVISPEERAYQLDLYNRSSNYITYAKFNAKPSYDQLRRQVQDVIAVELESSRANKKAEITSILPKKIEGYIYGTESIKHYPNNAGYSVRYSLNKSNYADIFIYPVPDQIKEYTHQDIVDIMASDALREIKAVEKSDIYQQFKILNTATLNNSGELTDKIEASMIINNVDSYTLIYLTEKNGMLMKARITMRNSKVNRSDPRWDNFVKKIFGFIKQNINKT